MENNLINVAIPNTGRKLFTYKCAIESIKKLSPGQRIIVPFGKRNLTGFFIDKADYPPEARIREIREIIDAQPLYDKQLFKFLIWMAEYYYAGIGDTLNAAIPPSLRRLKRSYYAPANNFESLIENYSIPKSYLKIIKQVGRLTPRNITTLNKSNPGLLEELLDNDLLKESWAEKNKTGKGMDSVGQNIFGYFKPRNDVSGIVPNEEQGNAINAISKQLNKFIPWLLYGITGSGKTLVYCHVASTVIKEGGTVLVLVPEIALAGTLLSYFQSFFGENIALLHSALTPKERLGVWQDLKDGRYKIVIGARSAIFAPLENLGLIIVDEEHDESYKQDDPSPRFQGRDAAVMRAKITDIPVILGTATPSMESFYNALNGRYKMLKLTRRPEKTELPVIRLIDLKDERPSFGNQFFSPTMISKIKESLRRNNQVILYLNRRGFSPRIRCFNCGFTPECPNCQISLTYHKVGQRLMCHFCGYIDSQYHTCSKCQSDKLDYIGTGTQKVEEKIAELFDNAKLIRLDSDSAAERNRAHTILAAFADKEYNLLLGTQMVTKGVDFPDVSLVGVLNADIGLDMPDFRAPEKLFAKLIQVSGRSGRGIIPGEVVIQTYNPNLDLIDDAARQDYDTFYKREIESREALAYPPFSHLVNFRLAARKEETVNRHSSIFKQNLESRLNESKIKTHLLGPAPSPLYRLRGMYRKHLFIKTKQITSFNKMLHAWEHEELNFGLPSSIKLIIDIDPYDMM